MNRAAWAARFFFAVALLPTVVAAGFAVYKFRTQPPPPAYREGGWNSPQIVASLGSTNNGFLLGAFAPLSKKGGPTVNPPREVHPDVAGLYSFDTTVNRRANLTVRYVGWKRRTTFPARYVIHAAALGAETVIELTPSATSSPSLVQIAAGTDDVNDWLQKFAEHAIAPRDRFILSFAPEMNGNWWRYGVPKLPQDVNVHANCKDYGYKYSADATPTAYVKAYRYVHDTLLAYFTKHHAKKLITFMWQPSAIHRTTLCPMPWWPGRHYVDEVGLDGYFYYTGDTFKAIFGSTLKYLKQKAPDARVMIGETAVSPKVHREKADLQSLFAGIRQYKLDGLIWFDANQLKRSAVPGQRIFHQDFLLLGGSQAANLFLAGLPSRSSFATFSRTYVSKGGAPLIKL
jgi:hypothetical protein